MLKNWSQMLKLKNSFVLVFLWIQVLLLMLTWIFYQQTVVIVKDSEDLSNRIQISNVYEKIDEAQKLALTVSLMASKNDALLNAFSKYDREVVRPIVDAIWKDLKPMGFAQFNLHYKPANSPDWKFFYRAQAPERFNDSADNRITITKANSTKSMVAGLEQGRTGYGFRAVTPLFWDSKHIGSLESGFELGQALLKELHENYPGNWAIYNLSRGAGSPDDRALIESFGSEKDVYFKNLMPEEYVIKKAKTGTPITEADETLNAKVLYILSDVSVCETNRGT